MCHSPRCSIMFDKAPATNKSHVFRDRKADRVMSVPTHLCGLIRTHFLRLAFFEDMGTQHHDPEKTHTPFADAYQHRHSELPGHSSPHERLYLHDPRAHLDIWTPVTRAPRLHVAQVRAWCCRACNIYFFGNKCGISFD